MKTMKKFLAAAIAVTTMAACMTTTVFAQTSESGIPYTYNLNAPTPRMVDLPEGEYHCLSKGREDSYIEIVDRTVGSDLPTAYFYKVYSSDAGGYISGSGNYDYHNIPEFNFRVTKWHYSGDTENRTSTVVIPTSYRGGDFILINGEIYSK